MIETENIDYHRRDFIKREIKWRYEHRHAFSYKVLILDRIDVMAETFKQVTDTSLTATDIYYAMARNIPFKHKVRVDEAVFFSMLPNLMFRIADDYDYENGEHVSEILADFRERNPMFTPELENLIMEYLEPFSTGEYPPNYPKRPTYFDPRKHIPWTPSTTQLTE